MGRVVLERYEILRRIGSGGMGAVYVGRQHTVDREVALKVLRAELVSNDHIRQRFRREAEIIAKLNHPNTIQLIDYGETDDGLVVMVMELLKGSSLSERLKTKGPMTLDETLRLGEEVASSLGEAHLIGLVHRDLKPANIFLTEVGREVHAKVLDFGIARLMDEEATRLTSTGQVFGTPRYMSPEQALSTADVDARSDLYSLGLILYECLVGQPPFMAQTSLQYLSAHTTQAPPKLRTQMPEAPATLEELIDACLAKEPSERPQTAEDVGTVIAAIRRSLEPAVAAMPIVVPRGTAPESSPSVPTAADAEPASPAPPPPPPARFRWVGIGLAVVALMIMGGVAMSRWRAAPVIEPVTERPDSGSSIVDGGAQMLAAIEADAGEVEGVPEDAGSPLDSGLTDSGRRRKGKRPGAGRKKPGGRKRPGKNGSSKLNPPPPPGSGVIVGPAGMHISTDDDEVDLVALAKSCRSSKYRGLAQLTIEDCPKGCAIIVDDLCAGRTPAKDRPISRGYRTVSVVCGGKIKRTATLQFRDEKNTTFTCH